MLKNIFCFLKKLGLTYLDLFLVLAFILALTESLYEGITIEEVILNILIDLILICGARVIILVCVQLVNTAIKALTPNRKNKTHKALNESKK